MTNLRLSEIGELTLIETIRKRFSKKSKGIIVGIGDDAAVIKSKGENLLITSDMMVESVHFDLSFITPYHLGYKLVSVNVSDIYAMGGKPEYLLLDIAMNKKTEKSFINRFFDGLQDAMKLYDISLIGGDISSSKKDMVIAASLMGYAEKPITRSGARPGDKIYVTGTLGDSACGLEILQRLTSESRQIVKILGKGERARRRYGEKRKSPILRFTDSPRLHLEWNIVKPLLRRHLMPEARNPKNFVKHATAMIDLSDGLFIDLSRLCTESRVGARIYTEYLPVSQQMKMLASASGLDSFKLATSGGEDYELLFTSPPDYKPRAMSHELKITCIGEITEKHRIVVDEKGREAELEAAGYQHFGTQG